MQVMPLGINYSTRKLLIDPMSSDQFGESILMRLAGVLPRERSRHALPHAAPRL